jgi:hypothetical protein
MIVRGPDRVLVQGITGKQGTFPHVATGEERERLFKELSRMSSSTESYQAMCAPRELPLVVLRPWSDVPA